LHRGQDSKALDTISRADQGFHQFLTGRSAVYQTMLFSFAVIIGS